jgi:GAF domain-containing protein
MIQRDYIERLIQQVVQALALMLRLREAADFGPALQVAQEAAERVLGPDHALLARLDASSMVRLVGEAELERVRLYAVLVGEEGAIHEDQGQVDLARWRYLRALELYGALSLAGFRLRDGDRERIAGLCSKVDPRLIDERYRDELRRAAGLGPNGG